MPFFRLRSVSSAQILAVKQRIASELGLGDAAEQKLIYLGKILTNEQTIAEVKIKPNEMLVVMTSKLKKPAAAPAPAAAAPAPAAAAATPAAAPAAAEPTAAAAAPAPAAAPAAAAATPAATPAAAPATPAAAPAPAAAVASSLQSSAASSIVMGSAYESSIVELMNLGFERQQVVDAMRAAYNNAGSQAHGAHTQFQLGGSSRELGVMVLCSLDRLFILLFCACAF